MCSRRWHLRGGGGGVWPTRHAALADDLPGLQPGRVCIQSGCVRAPGRRASSELEFRGSGSWTARAALGPQSAVGAGPSPEPARKARAVAFPPWPLLQCRPCERWRGHNHPDDARQGLRGAGRGRSAVRGRGSPRAALPAGRSGSPGGSVASSAPLSPLRPSWPCVCHLGRHCWCPQHGYERPQPTISLFEAITTNTTVAATAPDVPEVLR